MTGEQKTNIITFILAIAGCCLPLIIMFHK